MLMIRFQRVGRKNDPAFRIVVTEKHSKPKSGEIEILGAFHPKTKVLSLNKERASHWLSKGAQPSLRVHNIFIDQGVLTGKKMSAVKPPAMPPAGHIAEAPQPAAAETAV